MKLSIKILLYALYYFLLLQITISFQINKIHSAKKITFDDLIQSPSNEDTLTAAKYNEAQSKDFAYISMITHCTDQQIISWNCKLCKNITMTDVSMISNSTYDIAGFIGYSAKYNQIIISWRGTIDAKNWEQDFKFQKTNYVPKSGTCDKCQVHTGVYQSYKSVEAQITRKLTDLVAKHPTANITSTGHSLGGGLSLMTNLEIAQHYPQKIALSAYNYGCLRIGNAQFANFLKAKIPVVFRVVHNKDLVPHVPPVAFDYMHPPYEVLYDEEMKTYTVCDESGEDKNCSDRFVPNLDPNDHTFYFVKTDASVC